MEGKKKASNKQLPELKTWFNIDNPMPYNNKFVFMPGEAILFKSNEVILWLPIGANKYLQKAIKYSTKTTLFTIQEDEYNEKDWSIITKGLIERKNSSTNLKISFTKLHKSNIPFIRNIIRKSDITELIFHDCMIEAGCFDLFCDAICNSSPQIKKISLTKNGLTEQQIQTVEKVVSKIGKPLILYNSEIRSVTKQNQLKVLESDYNRYIFEWIDELTLDKLNIEDPRLCYAVKMSQCLHTINIKNTSSQNFKRMTKAIIGNKNIHSIKVNYHEYYILVALPEIFSKAKITELEITHQLGYSTVIENNRSLKHLIVERLFRFSENSTSSSFLDAVKKNESLTALTTKFDKMTSNQIVTLLRANPRISSLTIILSTIQSNSHTLKDILVPTLKELHLDASNIAGEANGGHLIEAISNSKTIEAFSLNGFALFHDSKFQEILQKNQTIKKIDFTRSGMRPSDSMELLEHLKFHPTLTSFAFDLDSECTTIFADILRTNPRLRHIGISLRTEKFNRHHIMALKDAIRNNRNLRSFSTHVNEAKHAAFMLDLIEESTSITSFKCTTTDWNDQYQEKIFLETAIDVLKYSNKVLTDISIVRHWSIVQVDPTIQKMLKRNKDQQLQCTNNILYFIGTMAARPQLYLSILPLEIWSNIFKRLSFPGVDLDFDKLLLERFDKS